MQTSSERVPELDGLRGIAITMVVLFHALPGGPELFQPVPALHRFFSLGPSGVDLFFVLSGFLITGILLDTRDLPCYFTKFYIRRVLRILPLYVCALVGFFGLTLPFLHHHGALLEVSESEQVWYWLFVQNWHDCCGHIIDPLIHFWSLAIEEQFYLLWPLLVFLCARKTLLNVCTALVAVPLVLRFAIMASGFVRPELLDEWIHRATITRSDTLAVGALIAIIVRDRDWKTAASGWIRIALPASLAAYIICPLLGSTFSNTLGYSAMAVICGCAVWICVANQGSSNPLCRLTRIAALQSLGRYSYAMYVLHLFVRGLVRIAAGKLYQLDGATFEGLFGARPLLFSLLFMAICLAAAYVAGFLSWHLMEKHFLRLKDRISEDGAVPEPAMP
jgi:peptidoglycan/LPS O-acetylase OafA/YrhL